MSRLDEALRRAPGGTTGTDNFSAPSAHALEWFAASPEAADPTAERVDRLQSQAAGPVDERGAWSPLLTAAVQARKASIIPLGGAAAERLVVNDAVGPAVVEQYRKIAATLHHAQADRGVR